MKNNLPAKAHNKCLQRTPDRAFARSGAFEAQRYRRPKDCA